MLTFIVYSDEQNHSTACNLHKVTLNETWFHTHMDAKKQVKYKRENEH